MYNGTSIYRLQNVKALLREMWIYVDTSL